MADKVPAIMAAACLKEGLIARPLPSIGALALSPPLVVTQNDVDLIVNRLTKALETL